MYDVVIVGAGAAGFGCALTLASANDKFEWAKDKTYLMFDNNKSDLNAAKYCNVAGVDFGINGVELLEKMKKQLSNFKTCQLKNDTVTKIEKSGDIFKITAQNETVEAKIVVLATGFHKFEIKCEGVEVKANDNAPKPNLIYLENKNNLIKENLYVAGLASKVPTMFSVASGDGAKVACDIFKQWSGKVAVVHDFASKK
ncbi:FAD-dependent oxidoreductase [Halarcobacter anaerophilus]|jgi:thioredoxin reductase|uniref:FAD-dependent oxidoreductase n=1 Tax=Halarcobacter anaerophilus TaxID=877500 RepID=UPI0005C8795C|nr:FAD-dependent oxidoreductase [Halarcobacter anaerophilus]